MSATIWAFAGDVAERQLVGFEVRASDGTIGTVDAATYDVGASYIVVDTGPWIFGKRVLLPAGLIHRVDRDAGIVHVGRSRDEIRSAPEFESDSVSAAYLEQLGRHYGGTAPVARAAPGAASTRRGEGPRRAEARRSTPRKGSSDQRTKDELYQEAKRLGIEGRSKMNKRELERAVERAESRTTARGSKARANPVEVQKFLDGVSYPARRGDLIREARSSGASADVRSTLERLPDKRFDAPTEVSEAIGELSGRS